MKVVVRTSSIVLVAILSTVSLRAQAQTPAAAAVELQGVDAHGNAFDLASLRGSVVAITFVSRYTQDEALRIHEALAAHADVKVVSIVDFVGIPEVVFDFVRRKVAEADGRVQHLCDEHGDLGRKFASQPDKRVDILVIGRDGVLRGRFIGLAQLEGARRLIDAARAQASR
ncbi:MAG TPA: hypothetical protein VIA18_05100 [Polyangia bacterium]|jgi:hypothetical protein|nr:hypothetical protein [Polyangia bacterium]